MEHTDGIAASNLDDLIRVVHETLCRRDRLNRDDTPIRYSFIRRSGRLCGIWFQIHGPRRLRSHAIWVIDEQRVLCYDSAGIKFAELRLATAPDPARLAA